MFSFKVTGVQTVTKYFAAAAVGVGTMMSNGLDYYGDELVNKVKEHASGAPGPRVITGHYRDSIHGEKSISKDRGTVSAYTDEEYGHRLEYGGTSRTQNRDLVTRPYPHFRPALLEVGKEFVDYIERTVKRI